ncbi:hypothetical protein HK100_004480 [Physocladia obscura]|uniref:Uncharacterized protein n=1 Tax=Physocladia obscura TaxID=109957 RepID=A0AAD5XCL2_9FUNG|nr:hypothetical protein HK100_004480 [Physocladia obscura]
MGIWTVAKQQIPVVLTEISRDKIAEMLTSTAKSIAASPNSNVEFFEQRAIDKPSDGSCLIAQNPDPDSDGWGWLDDELSVLYSLKSGLQLQEQSRLLGFSQNSSVAVITRKRYSISTAPEIQFIHYLKIKDSVPKVTVTKDAIKVDPSSSLVSKASVNLPVKKQRIGSGKKHHGKGEEEYWGFEDQSVPIVVSLARYKRNHEFLNELLSPLTPGKDFQAPKEKSELKVTADDILKLEAEIEELEEQNQKYSKIRAPN